jgi:MFS family permease
MPSIELAEGQHQNFDNPVESEQASPSVSLLFLASFAALFFELAIIRYLSTEVRLFAYFKNLALIACFLGIGIGMVIERPPKALQRTFPLILSFLFLLIRFAPVIGLTHLPFPTFDNALMGGWSTSLTTGHWGIVFFIGILLLYLAVVPGIMYLVMAVFTILGSLVGKQLKPFPSLKGYGVNLAGSFAGIAVFTLVSFLALPPGIWVLIGFASIVPFFLRDRWILAAFVLITGILAFPQQNTYWSPYYRITLRPATPPAGWPRPAAIYVNVNYDYHQVMLDLSRAFTSRFPDAEPNRYASPIYEIPYRLVPSPQRVLIIGAGTGNDVAAALRHGVPQVDAVEIDPLILKLGRMYHPERPYDSPRVHVYVDDGRSFLKKTKQKYDLIVFAYLDSHTLVSSMSSIRLDNYVYTRESFSEARSLLSENGTLVLAFASGRSFLSDRLFATIASAFDGKPPVAYYKAEDMPGVVFVEGKAASPNLLGNIPDISKELQTQQSDALIATDSWPFLYLRSRTVPFAIWSVLVLFLYSALAILKKMVPVKRFADRQGIHLFFLGAGFMLLETRGVTELSLLFGSTWIVNAVVIGSFLAMGILANAFVMFLPISRRVAYIGLFIILVASMFIRYSLFEGLPSVLRVLAAATLVGLPVFFSGLIFSRSFRDVAQPAQGLGINLFGAVVGGILENLVMVGGTPILGILAILLYGLSAVSMPSQSLQKSLELNTNQKATALPGQI